MHISLSLYIYIYRERERDVQAQGADDLLMLKLRGVACEPRLEHGLL